MAIAKITIPFVHAGDAESARLKWQTPDRKLADYVMLGDWIGGPATPVTIVEFDTAMITRDGYQYWTVVWLTIEGESTVLPTVDYDPASRRITVRGLEASSVRASMRDPVVVAWQQFQNNTITKEAFLAIRNQQIDAFVAAGLYTPAIAIEMKSFRYPD